MLTAYFGENNSVGYTQMFFYVVSCEFVTPTYVVSTIQLCNTTNLA